MISRDGYLKHMQFHAFWRNVMKGVVIVETSEQYWLQCSSERQSELISIAYVLNEVNDQ